MHVSFKVAGEPVGKARPRVFQRNGITKAITPQKTVYYENLVKLAYSSLKIKNALQGEIRANIRAYYSIPKSMTKKNRQLAQEGKLHPTKKPDLDNVAKIILDSLNGIAYKDDSQVVSLIVEKAYSEEPRVEITLSEM